MLQSMTAYTSQAFSTAGICYVWELRGVNHRYLDLNLKLPESLLQLEHEVRKRLKSQLHRGKVECVLKTKPDPDAAVQTFSLNEPLIEGIMHAATQLGEHELVDNRLRAMDLLRWPGVVSVDSELSETQDDFILEQLDEAIEQFVQHRAQEGEALGKILLFKTDELINNVSRIEAEISGLLAYQEDKLRTRIAELQDVEVDNNRLEQELVFLMQRLDIEEELTRLKTHVAKVRESINNAHKNAAVGKMLDFYMQELNREANTICSKSQNAKITQDGVDLKIVIEQMREQIQNIQ